MERSEFCKKFLASGIACSCVLGLKAGELVEPAVPTADDLPVNPAETPCSEVVNFTHQWIKRFVDILDQQLDESTRKKLMISNGTECARGYYGAIGDAKPASMEEIDKTIEDWQSKIGKENIFRSDHTIYFNYVGNPKGLKIADGYCLCPMIETGPSTLSPTYCQCSAGYVQFMFHKFITGKPVQVELLESLRGGGEACRFKVTI
jgi:hypothetical protein